MYQNYENCYLCPRACGANRLRGEVGFCGANCVPYLGRASPHYWEEPPLSGTHGSGTVFFVHCSLRCAFCQNYEISRSKAVGTPVTTKHLASIFLDLQDQGVHNINLVTSSHYAPHIADAIYQARNSGLSIPIVFNSSGYESVDTLRLLNGLIDVYLPDFKYYSSYYAQKYSAAPDYREVADDAIAEMVQQTGPLVYDEAGLLQRGTIIRHLMLPGLLGDTKQILCHIAELWGSDVLVSLMRQYTPCNISEYPELNRKLTDAEYQSAIEEMQYWGLSGFLQEREAVGESFIPKFEGVDIHHSPVCLDEQIK